MSETETIAGIVAEMRDEIKECETATAYVAWRLKEYADRIEAAAKREAAKLIPAANIEFSDGLGRRQIAVGWVKKGGEA